MDKIAPLPVLVISNLTAKYFDQGTVDRIVGTIYEERPDFFSRMACRESDSPGPHDPSAGPHDSFIKEFVPYLEKLIAREVGESRIAAATEIYREVRRRARLMHGMRI